MLYLEMRPFMGGTAGLTLLSPKYLLNLFIKFWQRAALRQPGFHGKG